VGGAFSGETVDYYARYRRGYPDVIVDSVVDRLHLGSDDTVIDLGCGTGLLTFPVARRVGLVLGVDPEPDMLSAARRGIDPALSSKVVWVLGSDNDILALGNLVAEGALGAVTVGQALHFMDYDTLFRRARRLLRPEGGIAVIANGTPLWHQDSEWSQCLRAALEEWFRKTLTAWCGTDRETQAQYADALTEAGYEIHRAVYDYEAELTLQEVLGGVYSALSPDDLPEDRRTAFADHIARALPATTSFTEMVPVVALIGVAR
jgi:ubiquinone/menaquinone biosynthesis C-methylase UbiE